MRNHIFAILILSQLVGCTTYYGMEIENRVPFPSSPPKIILGQDATVSVKNGINRSYLIEAWQKTGLFKSVTPVTNKDSWLTGTYILVDCESYSRDAAGDLTSFFLPLASVMTALAIPAVMWEENETCTTYFYQNGNLINTSYSRFAWDVVRSSWVIALFNNDQKGLFRQSYKTIAAHIVSTDLASLKKEFP